MSRKLLPLILLAFIVACGPRENTPTEDPFVFATDNASAYTQVDRMGMPAIATAVITSKDDYNAADPAEDAKLTFAGEIVTNVNRPSRSIR